MSDLKKLSETLGEFLETTLFTTKKNIIKIYVKWDEIVGPEVGRLLKPLYIKEGILYLGTKQPFMIKKGKFLEGKIISKISKEVPELQVKKIEITALNS